MPSGPGVRREEASAVVDLKINPKEVSCVDNSNIANCLTSCSGTFVNYNLGLVITTGLIFAPFFQLETDEDDSICGQHPLQSFLDESDGNNNAFYRNGLSESDSYNCDKSRHFFEHLEKLCDITVYVQNAEPPQHALNSSADKWSGHRRVTGPTTCPQHSPNVSRDSMTWVKKRGQVLAVWKCPQLGQVLDTIVNPSGGWTFLDVLDAASVFHSSQALMSPTPVRPTQEERYRNLLPLFVLLKVNVERRPDAGDVRTWLREPSSNVPFESWMTNTLDTLVNQNFNMDFLKSLARNSYDVVRYLGSRWRSFATLAKAKPCAVDVPLDCGTSLEDLKAMLSSLMQLNNTLPRTIHVGDTLHLVATPFGSLSPGVFLNSISDGIVTNIAGQGDVLMMTDARCVPGCEGGAVFVRNDGINGRHKLAGIIVAPFCWRQNEWVGLTFACSLRSLLTSLLEAIAGPAMPNSHVRPELPPSRRHRPARLSDNVGLVKVGSRWGSATIVRLDNLPSGELLLLTCSHVIRKKAGSKVRVRFIDDASKRFYVEAVVLYATPPEQVYDIAVLSALLPQDGYPLPTGLQLQKQFANEGDGVIVIGHGLFDDHVGIAASVTSGVISKVLYETGQQVLLQSTCAVHPGVSGGALFDTARNKLCGIVVCNARDAVIGACYPHINLSVPSTILYPVLHHFAQYKDSSIFQQLQECNPVINSFWQLGYNQLGLKSKL